MLRLRIRTMLSALTALCGLLFTAAAPAQAAAPARHGSRFVVSEVQFERMFPDRNSFYTYGGLLEATEAYPAFARTGSRTVRKQEAAAFLANISHETGGLFYVRAQNEETYPIFCDATQPYGCPAGTSAYYGRGAIMLSWNFNYKAAGDALGLDLLNNPWLVETDPAVAWMTALWYWNTQTGPGTMTGHDAITGGHGFGQTIWSLNGSTECNGGRPDQMQHRVDLYLAFTDIVHTAPGANLTC